MAQYEIEKLTIKALLNLPADEDFDIAIPQVETIPVDNILEIAAEDVFHMALNTQPQVQINALRLAASEKFFKAAKSRLYPTISAFGQIGTTFNQNSKLISVTGTQETAIGFIKDPYLPVYTLTPVYSSTDRGFGGLWEGYGKQLKNNLGKSFGLVISVPLFNGYQARSNLERAKLDITRKQLSLTRDTLQLKQDVYNAYQQAYSAYQTYMARQKQVETAQRSFELASKRYEVGVMQTIEWLTNQNNYTRARIEKLVSQYDFVFKMKVLEFYKGQGLRL
ncbi:MAG: TolC family protein, partial [Chitinophagaceae bacterium]